MTPSLLIADGVVHQDLDPDTLAAVHAHIDPLLGRELPQWGTSAWFALPAGHPDRVAATDLGAHAWWASVVFGAGVPREVLERQVAEVLKATALAVRGGYDLVEADASRLQVARRLDWPRAIAGHVPHGLMTRRRYKCRGEA